MLRLVKITKDYKVADSVVRALKGIDLSFRKNEFVSILGQSGCGKTTLLNIIGGLDKYTTGDLYINGRSTKEFVDRDWDVYRNHRVGFIFQSYNLIPHQSVLGNVELALTIGGVSKAERIRRAKLALDKVGLSSEYYKRPNQLSGGQSQRVAIARALVNDPEILLADEPTGALDTETSKNIMDLIKEIAKERLVIMVTHNPELAHEYSTRIIRLLDGELKDDSNPYLPNEEQNEQRSQQMSEKENQAQQFDGQKRKKERAKMSILTSLRLSIQNLFTKKARTLLTSVAGSIGIIGISLVLSVSYGVQRYIDGMQNDMLSGNPISISQTAVDFNALMNSSGQDDIKKAVEEYGFVNVESLIEYLVSRSSTLDSIFINNTITQEYVDYVSALPKEDAADVFLDYGIDVTNNFYTDFRVSASDEAQKVSLSCIRSIYTSVLNKTDFKDFATYITSLTDIYAQAPDNDEYILSQYDIVDGKVAKGKNEIMIVLDQDKTLTDILLAQLGYYTQDEFLNIGYRASEDENTENPKHNPALDKERFSYKELMDKTFTWYPNDVVFEKVSGALSQYNPFNYKAYADASFSQGLELKVVGILRPKSEIAYGCLESGFYYTEALTRHIIEKNLNSELIEYFEDNDIDQISSGIYEIAPNYKINTGITFKYSFTYEGVQEDNVVGFVGTMNTLASLLGSLGISTGGDFYSITRQQAGGVDLAYRILVYPVDFETKQAVLDYLDRWNSDEDIEVGGVVLTSLDREDIIYSDPLAIVIALINDFIQIVTFSLIGFTALSLLVSSVMIAIITYVSVVERIKEIGVIRSLGGRKRDVSTLFIAETFIIGTISGIIGIVVTYIGSAILNLIINSFAAVGAIAVFPWFYAVLMVAISVSLTCIAGIVPAGSAAKKDPVVALRTE